MKQKISTLIIAASSLLVSVYCSATPILSWDFSLTAGGGTLATLNPGNQWTLEYVLNPSDEGLKTWAVASSVVTESGDYTFNWFNSGFYGNNNVRALLTPSGSTISLVDATPTGGFSFSGVYTFTGVNVGDVLGFTLAGSSSESSGIRQGTLKLIQQIPVPEPGTGLLLGLALLTGVGMRKRHLAILARPRA